MTQRFGDDPQSIPGGRIIAKGIIRAYVAGTHKADVQLVGSHPAVLTAIRVATDIPAADVVAGRQCTVLFLDPANQDDAVVLTIQGALPSGGGGGTTDHAVLTNLAYAGAAHTGFQPTSEKNAASGYAGLDASTALNTAQIRGLRTTTGPTNLAMGAVADGQLLRRSGATIIGYTEPIPIALYDSSSNLRVDASHDTVPWVDLYDDAMIQGNLTIGTVGVDPKKKLYVYADPGNIASGGYNVFEEQIGTLTFTNSGQLLKGITGLAYAGLAAGKTAFQIFGLNFDVGAAGSGGAAAIAAVWVRHFGINYTGIATTIYGHMLKTPVYAAAATIQNVVGWEVEDQGPATNYGNVTGLLFRDTTLNTGFTRLLELGGTIGTLPNLRLEGRAPTTPGAAKGRSQLLLTFNENGVVALRREEWKDFATLAAGDKVRVAV